MAFWFTEEKAEGGPIFGGPERRRGLEVFLDSFDNDGQQDNPQIQVVMNDGATSYDHYVPIIQPSKASKMNNYASLLLYKTAMVH